MMLMIMTKIRISCVGLTTSNLRTFNATSAAVPTAEISLLAVIAKTAVLGTGSTSLALTKEKRKSRFRLFKQFGHIQEVTMKGRYAFVEFESAKDAEHAIRETQGISFHGYQITVELSSK
jgi:hypothetical protein